MMTEFCPACGARRTGAFRFCRSCGHDFEAGAPPAEVVPRPVPRTEALPPVPGALQRLPIERILIVLIALTAVGGFAILTRSPATPTVAPSSSTAPTLAAAATPSPIPTTNPPATQEAVGRRLIGLTLPPRWTEVKLTADALRQQIAALEGANPDLARVLEQLLNSGGYKVVAYFAVAVDSDAQLGSLTGTVLPTAATGLDSVQPTLEAGFRQLGATGIAWRHVPLAAGDALVADFTLPVYVPAASAVVMTDRVFHVLVGSYTYQLTFTCYPGNTAACLADADAIARTLTLTPEARGQTPL